MKRKLPKISDRERDVMLILWGESVGLTSSAVVEKGTGLNINTVQAAMRNLMKKEYIKIDDIVYSGTVLTRSYIPVVSAEEFAVDQLYSLKDNVLNFSALNFVKCLNKDDDTDILDALENVIRQKKEQEG